MPQPIVDGYVMWKAGLAMILDGRGRDGS